MNKLLEIEMLAKQLEEETNSILNRNFPMDSREFLMGEDAARVKNNDEKIVSLSKQYFEAYKALSSDEQRKCNYTNIRGAYYQNTHKIKGLIKAYSYSDESELHEAFSKATHFGMSAIEGMINSKNNNDQNEYIKNERILQNCISILSVHYWGENRIESLQRYFQRLEKGRTADDDLNDYKNLIQECINLSIEYAKANINGLSNEEKTKYIQMYDNIYEKEKLLTEFLPREMLSTINVNLHWMKVDAERNPQNLINNQNTEITQKSI